MTHLEQPVGSTHYPTPAVAPSSSDRDEQVLEASTVREPPAPYYRLCDLPDTVHEAPRFPTGSSRLRARGQAILNQVANCMVRGALMGQNVVVVGYADARGSRGHNTALARERAEAVARYLAARGVPPHRVRAATHGEYYATGHGPESWQLDRRVEVRLPVEDQRRQR